MTSLTPPPSAEDVGKLKPLPDPLLIESVLGSLDKADAETLRVVGKRMKPEEMSLEGCAAWIIRSLVERCRAALDREVVVEECAKIADAEIAGWHLVNGNPAQRIAAAIRSLSTPAPEGASLQNVQRTERALGAVPPTCANRAQVGSSDLVCPLCGEGDFDALGLVSHYRNGWCSVMENPPTPRANGEKADG